MLDLQEDLSKKYQVEITSIDSETSDFFGRFYLFFYNITKLRIVTSKELGDTENINIYDDIYKTERILMMSKRCVILAEKYFIFFFLFMGLKKICRWLYIHVRFSNGLIPLKYILYFFLLFILYSSKNIYKYQQPNAPEFDFCGTHYVYNKIYFAIYWILILLQGGLFLLLLFLIKLNIEDEILVEISQIRIGRYFTIEEKITIFK